MTTIDRTGASDTEFETRIAPFEADALADALVDVIGRGCSTCSAGQAAPAWATTAQDST
jgi:hypothetical protein